MYIRVLRSNPISVTLLVKVYDGPLSDGPIPCFFQASRLQHVIDSHRRNKETPKGHTCNQPSWPLKMPSCERAVEEIWAGNALGYPSWNPSFPWQEPSSDYRDCRNDRNKDQHVNGLCVQCYRPPAAKSHIYQVTVVIRRFDNLTRNRSPPPDLGQIEDFMTVLEG